MRQPREGEVLWRRVSGGRALHAITCVSWPSAVCGVEPRDNRDWCLSGYSWSVRRKHKQCERIAPRGRINFWPDYVEE